MNVVLIGYRGTGKSVVGRIVADRLGMECVSMDEEIVKRAGMSVPGIVEKEGWPGFRDRETAVARDLAGGDNMVIDCAVEAHANYIVTGDDHLLTLVKAEGIPVAIPAEFVRSFSTK